MSDLVRGRHPVTHWLAKLSGFAGNITQSNIAPRSNLEAAVLGPLTDTATALSAGVMTVVAVPVEAGDTISAIDVLVGATAGTALTNSWAALYSGIASPALLAQSTTGGSAAIPVSARYTFTLTAAQTITPATAPNGYVYVAIMVAATATPSLASGAIPAAIGYRWFPNGPVALAGTAGTGLTTTAPALLPAVTAAPAAPVVFLR